MRGEGSEIIPPSILSTFGLFIGIIILAGAFVALNTQTHEECWNKAVLPFYDIKPGVKEIVVGDCIEDIYIISSRDAEQSRALASKVSTDCIETGREGDKTFIVFKIRGRSTAETIKEKGESIISGEYQDLIKKYSGKACISKSYFVETNMKRIRGPEKGETLYYCMKIDRKSRDELILNVWQRKEGEKC